MAWRFFVFVALQGLCAALGAWGAGLPGALAGVLMASWLAFALESWRGLRTIAWLREGDAQTAPQFRGLWGQALDRMRRRLREQEKITAASDARLQAFLAALQASPNGVLLLDAQDHIEWCNHTAAGHFGLQLPGDLMQSVGYLLREPAFSAYLAAGDFAHDLIVPGRQSRPAHPVQLSVQLYPYGQGRRLMLSRDVTQIEQAEAMRRDFVANVSHEIRTPLTVLSGFIETLQTLPLDEAERARYLTLMAQQAQRMNHLVQDLLTLSRLEGSAAPSWQEWTSVRSLIERCETEARTLSAQRRPPGAAAQRLEFPSGDFLQRCGDIAGNAQELHSALSNLVSNAVRYTPAGGSIVVSWQPQSDGGARFAVRDSGPGIAPEHLPRLAERFYRVDRSRSRDSGGTGLGLAIAKHALGRHGAALHIASTLGQGAEFAATFGAARLRAADPAQTDPAQTDSAQTDPSKHPAL